MKFYKGIWSRMIPVAIMMIVTVIISVHFYQRMVHIERETCWERLEIATLSTAEKIKVRLNDNLNFLESVADSFILTNNLDDTKHVSRYLISVKEQTVFDTLDVILPNEKKICEDGSVVDMVGFLSFEELVSLGTHISPRITDIETGEEVIYCFSPIETNGKVQGILIGTLTCQTMSNLFEVFTYGGDAQIFLIDCTDGSYLIDNWHEGLGNVHNLGTRQGLNGDEVVNFVPAILNRETGRVAFISETNGEHSYQYYAPVEGFNWELCVMVQEDVVFRNVHQLQRNLLYVGIVEAVLLVFFLAWNLIINRSMTQTEKKAKQLEMERATNEAKAKFISNVSHDIRTPINGIVGMLYMIRKNRQDAKMVDECLDKIQISTQYLSTLANDMLDINEIENNRLIIENSPVDLRKLADDIRDMMEAKAVGANVSYEVIFEDMKHPYVLASTVHIERILVNLIANAIKYKRSTDAHVWVTIAEKEMEKNRSFYLFEVRDDGIGMTEEFQKSMYNAFSQEQISARSSYEGYGLGLTIVRQLVKKLGGTIELSSHKNEGSAFKVLLPLQHDILSNHQEINKEEENISLEGMHILLVEDNELNMEIAEAILTDMKAVITKAENGKIATEIFAESEVDTFDLVLMDIMMPEMDGFEATEVIRGMDRKDAKTVPVIAMTASAFTEEIEHCKKVGMNEHIAKPLDIEKLQARLAKYKKS